MKSQNEQDSTEYTLTEKSRATILITGILEGHKTFLEVSKDIDSSTCEFREFRGNQDITYRLLMSADDSMARWQGRKQAEYHISPDILDLALIECDNSLERIKSQVEWAKNHPAYNAMLEIANDKIEHYASDFSYHDCLQLAKSFDRPFLWAVRSTGTRFHVSNDDTILNYDLKNNPDTLYFFYAGYNETLLECENKNDVSKAFSTLK